MKSRPSLWQIDLITHRLAGTGQWIRAARPSRSSRAGGKSGRRTVGERLWVGRYPDVSGDCHGVTPQV